LEIPYLEPTNLSVHGYPPASYLRNPVQAYHK
jgi:hypothetical protein